MLGNFNNIYCPISYIGINPVLWFSTAPGNGRTHITLGNRLTYSYLSHICLIQPWSLLIICQKNLLLLPWIMKFVIWYGKWFNPALVMVNPCIVKSPEKRSWTVFLMVRPFKCTLIMYTSQSKRDHWISRKEMNSFKVFTAGRTVLITLPLVFWEHTF